MPDVAITLGRVTDAERVAGHVVAHPKGFANNQGLQLRVTEQCCALRFEVSHVHPGGCILTCIGGRRVPDRRRPSALLAGQRDHTRRWNSGLERAWSSPIWYTPTADA